MADLGNALLVIVRQQPPAPELPVASLLVLSQGPAAIGLVAVFYQLIEVLHLQRCPRQLRHLPAGMAHIGLILQRNPKGAAQVEQDGPVLIRRQADALWIRCPLVLCTECKRFRFSVFILW